MFFIKGTIWSAFIARKWWSWEELTVNNRWSKKLCSSSVVDIGRMWCIQNQIEKKLKKVNKKKTVTVRRVIIFLNILRHPLLICLQCCLYQNKTLKAVATATAAIVLLTPAKNLKKVFWGF
jgi:hypothetical protein